MNFKTKPPPHAPHRFHLEINSLEDFLLFCWFIRGGDGAAADALAEQLHTGTATLAEAIREADTQTVVSGRLDRMIAAAANLNAKDNRGDT